MKRKKGYRRVAVVMGGSSNEREISLRSGRAVTEGLRNAGYDVEPVDLRDGHVVLPPDVEAVFIAMHGVFGEDGQLQSRLEDLGVPYTGSGPEASERAMDKIETKKAFEKAGVTTPTWRALKAEGPCPVPLPVVVKPAREGSSIGVHIVRNEDAWSPAVRDALRFSGTALVEAYIAGRELTVGIVGDTVLPVVEIRAPEGHYGYAAKYVDHETRYLAPAPLSDDEAEYGQRLARQAFDALDCRDFGRVDFRRDEAGVWYALEVNTIPGFTESSLLPKAAAVIGWEFPALCDRILSLASLKSGKRMQ